MSSSTFSYAGSLRVTIATDAAVVADPARVVRRVEEEARALVAALAGAGARDAVRAGARGPEAR
jgi:hypothetical protein